MPVVCDACGSPNRETAMFCRGCAGRLRGFAPSVPSALDAMNASLRRARSRGAPTPALPAEAPAFWLRLLLLGLVMVFGFMAWFLYVTRQVSAPARPNRIAAAPTPEERPVAVRAAQDLPAGAAATIAAPPAALPAQSAPAPDPAAQSLPDVPVKAARTSSEQRGPQSAEARPTARPPGSGRVEQLREPAPAAVVRAPALARAGDDPGPPIAAGPGPQYSWKLAPSRSYEADQGPPLAIGPGPLYDASRPAARVPSWASSDPGPPIAVGPGPLVDYSVRAVRSR